MEFLRQIIAWVVPPFLWAFAILSFPRLFGNVFLKAFDHYQDRRLERLKAELAQASANQIERVKAEMVAAYSTLKSSVDFFIASQGEVTAKRITAVEILWKAILNINNEFGKLLLFDAVRTPEEMDSFFKNPTGDRYFFAILEEYQAEDATIKKWGNADALSLETERLYVSGHLWEIFYIYRAVLGRIAWLTKKSFEDKAYRNWRTDSHTTALLSSVMSNDEIDQAKQTVVQGLQILNQRFYNAFLEEAEKVMSGSSALSKSIFDIQTTMIAEKDRLAASWRT